MLVTTDLHLTDRARDEYRWNLFPWLLDLMDKERHRELAIEGVQFHPESIMTPDGVQLLRNFLDKDYESLLR